MNNESHLILMLMEMFLFGAGMRRGAKQSTLYEQFEEYVVGCIELYI